MAPSSTVFFFFFLYHVLQSLKVADAIYQSNWYEAPPAVQKRLRLCIMRAQKPIVTKGGFIKATLPTLKKVWLGH